MCWWIIRYLICSRSKAIQVRGYFMTLRCFHRGYYSDAKARNYQIKSRSSLLLCQRPPCHTWPLSIVVSSTMYDGWDEFSLPPNPLRWRLVGVGNAKAFCLPQAFFNLPSQISFVLTSLLVFSNETTMVYWNLCFAPTYVRQSLKYLWHLKKRFLLTVEADTFV